MSTAGTKILFAFLTTYLAGGGLMKMPQINDFIGLDSVGSFVYYVVFGVTLCFGIVKYAIDNKQKYDKNQIELEKEKLELYERRKMIDEHYGKGTKKEE